MQKDQNGFTIIGGVAILAVVALVGIGAYFAYLTVSTSRGNKVATSGAPSPAPDLLPGWKALSSAEGKFTFKYPAAWATSDCTGNGIVSIFVASSKDNLGVCQSDSVAQINVVSVLGNRTYDYQELAPGGTNVTLSDGTKAYMVREANRSHMSPTYKLAVYKQYIFAKSGRTYAITYIQDINRGFPDTENEFTTMVEKSFVVE
jgi:hypothetical protein